MPDTILDRSSGGGAPKRARNAQDASLLFCCMDVLQIDHTKVAQDDPLLYRELQGVCSLCPNKRDCALDLSGGFAGMRWDEWWLYCPNSAMLTTIGALQKCRHPPHYNSASAFSRLQLPKSKAGTCARTVARRATAYDIMPGVLTSRN